MPTEFTPPEESNPPQEPLTEEHSSLKVDLSRSRSGRHMLRKILLVVGSLFVVAGASFGGYLYAITKTSIVEKPREEQADFIDQVYRIIDNDVEKLKGEKEDQINIVLFGQGGQNHPGGTLADTIMVASIKPSTKQVALISIPRDLNVAFYGPEDTKKTYPLYYKINSSIFRGGNDLAVEKVEEVTGLDIQYYAVVDFDGFRQLIDTMGGVDVNVETAFTDYEFPDYNYGYDPVSFTAGVQHFDGETALQYARSRHGNNGEGSDFARAKRQQKILEAVQEKALSLSTLLNPNKISKLLKDIGDHAGTNMEVWEMVRFAELAKEIDKNAIAQMVIDNGPEGFLSADTVTGYNLVPNAGLGDYSEIHEAVADIFVVDVSTEEQATIAVQNGSSITGLGKTIADELESEGMEVTSIANAQIKTATETLLYDLTKGEKPETLQLLEDLFGVNGISATLPGNVNTAVRQGTDIDPNVISVDVLPQNPTVDFIILVGSQTLQTMEQRAQQETAAVDEAGQTEQTSE